MEFLPFFSRMYLYTRRFLFIINMLSVLLETDFETVYMSGNFVFLKRKKPFSSSKKRQQLIYLFKNGGLYSGFFI